MQEHRHKSGPPDDGGSSKAGHVDGVRPAGRTHTSWEPPADLSEAVIGGPTLERIYRLSGRLQRLPDADTTAVESPGTTADCDGLDGLARRIRAGATELVDLVLIALGRQVSLGYFLGVIRPSCAAQEDSWSEFLVSLGISPPQAHAAIRFSRHLDTLEEARRRGGPSPTITPTPARQDPSPPIAAGHGGLPGGRPGDRARMRGGRLLDAMDEAIGVLESGDGEPGSRLGRLVPPLIIALEWLDAARAPSDASDD